MASSVKGARKIGKVIAYILVALIANLVFGYVVIGPSVLIGGPSKTNIIMATRAAMIAAEPNNVSGAQIADITPNGICRSTDGGGYACIVTVSVAGSADQVFVSELQKTTDGTWVATQ